MLFSRRKAALWIGAVALVPAVLLIRARGSDHADTPSIAASPGTDITDVFIFPSPLDANNVVLVMNVHPLIPSGGSAGVDFDPNVLYQFKINNTGTSGGAVEDLVVQAKFTGAGASQTVQIAGPVKPTMTGTQSVFETPNAVTGTINTPFTLTNGVKVFAGAREDPFFFDLNAFFAILPDRATPITGIPDATPNTPKKTTFNGFAGGPASVDFLKGLNVLSIVVEMPKTLLTTGGDGKIRVWCTTSR